MNTKAQTIRNVILFILVVLSCGWVGVWVDSLMGETAGDFGEATNGTSGMGIFIVTPVLMAIFLRTFMGDGWRDAGLRPLIKQNWKWYGVATLIYPAVIALTLLIGRLCGWITIQIRWQDYLGGLGVFVLVEVVKNFFEESAWRGYLTARLLSLKIKDVWLYLIVASVWCWWHLPYFFYFLQPEQLYAVFPYDSITFLVMAFVTIGSWTVMYTELFRLTGSIWAGVWMHAIEDSIINNLIYDKHILVETGKEILISPVSGIIPCGLFLIVGLLLREARKRQLITQ
ncbi:MAG: CPBP family intramembrane metalloprotease [Capnocytophaga sp.]|nr:CPBP family intramembrane metalloprotease [Capnocytophaga sp.]